MPAATYTQTNRPLAVTTPLGPDVLLLVAFRGQEAISKPFHYELDLVAPNRTAIPFERLMGQAMSVELRRPRRPSRFFHGLVSRFSQGHRDAEFTHYQAELVPPLWLLTKRFRSRIFQQRSVPEILQDILQGLEVRHEIQGTFHPRDYCAQYRESDFAFANRLMEEEGIFYFFQHSERGCQLVLANLPQSHREAPDTRSVRFEQTRRAGADEEQVTSWRKVQELRSGKCQLWDHSFELPRQNLEASRQIQDDVVVGQVNHKLAAGLNGKLEIYEHPGGYAQRFDGIDRNGGEQPAELQKIFEDNQRTVRIRMQEEAVPGLTILGAGTCCQFLPGHKFTLTGQGHGDGTYVLTHVQHTARQPGYGSADRETSFTYDNSFTCLPNALPYRPARETPRPLIHGTQTATVVGPPGEEIFVDKYGRVKVQFHWDREGQNDANSSCWIRVAQLSAGKTFGTIFWPRVGHEVVVAFEEGDPDRPMIIGSVYNAENTMAYQLPIAKDRCGLATQSTPGATSNEYNELTFSDRKGSEEIYFRAQRDFYREVLGEDHLTVGENQTIEIKKGRKIIVQQGGDETTVEKGKVVKTYGEDYEVEAGCIYLRTGKGANVVKVLEDGVEIEGAQAIVLRAPFVGVKASAIQLKADLIKLEAPLVKATGIVQCKMLVADAVAASGYSNAPGNLQ